MPPHSYTWVKKEVIKISFLSRFFGGDDRRKHKYHAIHRAYRDLMFHAAHRILQNDADAEDAVHEALIAVWQNIDRYDLPPDPYTRSSVLLITENKAIDLLRRKQKISTIPLDEVYTPGAAYTHESIGLIEAIDSLPEDLRSVLLLRYKMGYSTHEIGEMLGKSHHMVSKLITRAKKELAEKLKED